MKKINLLDILGLTDNEIINLAIETDNSSKLKELKVLEKRKKCLGIFKYASMFLGGVLVLVMGFSLFNNINDNDVLVPNPMIEVKKLDELANYIKLDLSKYELKEIKEMYKFSDDNLIQIKYNDGSTLRISEKVNDNSGIYGSVKEKEEIINGINVNIYKFNNTIYATWDNNNYSFSYVFSENEDISILSKLV